MPTPCLPFTKLQTAMHKVTKVYSRHSALHLLVHPAHSMEAECPGAAMCKSRTCNDPPTLPFIWADTEGLQLSPIGRASCQPLLPAAFQGEATHRSLFALDDINGLCFDLPCKAVSAISMPNEPHHVRSASFWPATVHGLC